MYFTSEQFKFTHQTNTYKGNIRICIWEAQGVADATETVVCAKKVNIFLYERGQTTKAYVYKLLSTHNVDRTVYEFKVSNERYKGEDMDSKLGDSIEVVYLPKNPKINRNAKAIDKDWCVWAYRKITE